MRTLLRPTIFLLWFALWPNIGVAQTACDIAIVLERLQFAQIRLIENSATNATALDLAAIIEHAPRLDGAAISLRFDGKMPQDDIATIQLFAVYAQRHAGLIGANRRTDLFKSLNSPHFDSIIKRTGTIVAELQCNVQNAPKAVANDAPTTKKPNSTPSAKKINYVSLGLGLILLITGCICVIALVKLWQDFQRRKIRRAKRYKTHHKTQFSMHSETTQTIILDISCNGAKLRHGRDAPPALGDICEIYLQNEWKVGKIQWANPQFCGVTFNVTLKSDFVKSLRSITPKNTVRAQKTAP